MTVVQPAPDMNQSEGMMIQEEGCMNKTAEAQRGHGPEGGRAQGPTMRLCCETRWEVMREVGRARVGILDGNPPVNHGYRIAGVCRTEGWAERADRSLMQISSCLSASLVRRPGRAGL